MSYYPNYKECFLIAKVKKVVDNDTVSYILDLPFQITSQQVIYNSKNYYHRVPEIEGIEVLAHVTYFAKDDALVKKYSGYIADNSVTSGKSSILKCLGYAMHWKEKLSESLATQVIDKDTGEVTLIPYDGTDKDTLSIASVFLKPDYEDK